MQNNFMENFVSIIIPVYNEEKFIAKCLDSVINGDYPKENLEVLVVDGMSKDKSREIINSYSQKYSFVKLLENPKRIAAVALNVGIKQSKGSIIVRLDAHTLYGKDYISKCVAYLLKYNADNVGGVISIIPREKTLMGRGIARSLSSSFGTGGASYKTGAESFKEADTVPFGCFKREVFDKVGLFNENLKRSQDMEFNLRLKRGGGKIYLFPDIVSYYYVRSNLKDFFVHNFKDGIWAVYPLKFVKTVFKPRHYAPLVFVLGLLFLFILGLLFSPFLYLFFSVLLLYICAMFYFSAKIAIREKKYEFLVSLPFAFATRHFGYGLGSIAGLIKLFL
jgi:glycosyltransferase involved in cell wall biosynthesis